VLELDISGPAGAHELRAAIAVEAGHCLALAGPSGAGKTTLLRMIAGLARPASGRIALGGRVLFDSAAGVDLPPERRRCGCVFQDYALFDQMPVWRNVAYGMDGVPRRARRGRARELLARLGAEQLADAHPRDLSGGERQRVALARAVASEPDLLLFDEPLTALDVQNRAKAAREIAVAVADACVPAVLVTHDYFEAALIGDRIAVLDAGRIVQSGSAEQLSAQPSTPFVADLTGANVLRGRAERRPDGLTRVELDGGGALLSTDRASGRVAATVQPWEIVLSPVGAAQPAASTQNLLAGTILSVAALGNRARIGLELPQPVVAEVTAQAASDLGLVPGAGVVVQIKAAAVRLFEL
jgi:molybdate transport system ATP-binding protein